VAKEGQRGLGVWWCGSCLNLQKPKRAKEVALKCAVLLTFTSSPNFRTKQDRSLGDGAHGCSDTNQMG